MTDVTTIDITVAETTMPTVVTLGGVTTVPDVVEVLTGMPGPEGPPGPASTPTVTGLYTWVETFANRGDGEALGPGQVAGDEIADGGSQLQITQVDSRGFSYEWMQMQPGDRVIIRDQEPAITSSW